MAEEIVNRVANSSLVQLDLDDFYYSDVVLSLDIANQLYEGLILREKDFRTYIEEEDWSKYNGKAVAVYCSADAIIPNWAYMLIASALDEVGAKFHFGSEETMREKLTVENFENQDFSEYSDKPIIVKGCGKANLSPQAYLRITEVLKPHVKSLMFGEACSSVPVFKRK